MESVKNTTATVMPEIKIDKTQTTSSVREKEVVEKKDWRKILKSHLRRITIEIVNLFFNYDWVFWLIGLVNRKVNLIESVFLVYPATEQYALAYVFRYRLPIVEWNPWPCGLLWQNKKIALMFAISANNGQFSNPQNTNNIKQTTARMEHLRQLLGAKRKTFAGILPGVLYSRRIIREAPEADLTATAVVQAIENVKVQESLNSNTPIVVLGGKGFIGRRVLKLLNGSVYSIDTADCQDSDVWPVHLSGQRVIVVNITLNNALQNYVGLLWPGAVVINEVYPEPSQDILAKLRDKNCACYHIVGVKALAFPPFPGAYQGAIPCCAAWPSSQMKVVVQKMN